MVMSETTVRELKIMIDNLTKQIKDGFDRNEVGHKELIRHAKHTNGNVMKNTTYRYLIMGAIGMITAVLLPVAFIVLSKYI